MKSAKELKIQLLKRHIYLSKRAIKKLNFANPIARKRIKTLEIELEKLKREVKELSTERVLFT